MIEQPAPIRVIEALKFLKDEASVVEGADIVRVQGNRLIVAGKRVLKPPEVSQRIAPVIKRARVVRIYLERPLDQLLSFNELASLKQNNSEEMGRIKMFRSNFYNISIKLFSLNQLATLMQRNCIL